MLTVSPHRYPSKHWLDYLGPCNYTRKSPLSVPMHENVSSPSHLGRFSMLVKSFLAYVSSGMTARRIGMHPVCWNLYVVV